MEKKVIIIPKYIDGYQVCEFINRYRPSAPVIIREPYTKRIFITFKLVEFNKQSIVNQNVLFIGDGLLNAERYGCFNYHAFLPYNVDLSKEHHENVRVNHANITYMVDDEIYWIDTCENGPIDYIPVEPKKDGYKFLGWYKDKEFLNKWDFAYDIVPPSKKITHEVDSPSEWTEIVYEEVMLYAKFDLLLRFIKYQN